MRYQGRVKMWKDDKGYGFIAPNGGGPEVFVHISALGGRASKPGPGRLVTYELSTDERGRPRASNVQFVGVPQEPRRSGSRWATAGLLALAGSVGYVAYHGAQPGSTVPGTTMQGVPREMPDDRQFACSPEKNSCSRMTSCAEALFHMRRCGVQGMDGDNDGIPCEQQWCN